MLDFLIAEKGRNSPVCVAGRAPEGNVCELKAHTPDGEIEIGNKCDRNRRPGGGSGFKISIAPFAFPSQEIGVAKRERRPEREMNPTDCFFTQIKHSVKYSRARMSSSV